MKRKQDFGLPRVKLHQRAADQLELSKIAQQEGEQINWAGSLLGIPDVWIQTMGDGVKVAVLDTGIDLDHPDLADGIVEVKDFTNEGIEDGNGHGTHCAGIIAARLNDTGFVGVAPRSQLLIAKVLTNEGGGAFHWIADAVLWAVEQGADIISMSLGGPYSSNRLYQAIHVALAKGVMVICAAGNEGSLFQNSIGYPGRYGGVITIASHDQNGNRSGFSSRGGEIDLMAPGSHIWSTYRDGGYAELSGTSMATPFVSGLAALIVSRHSDGKHHDTPLDNNEDLKNHLLWMAAHPGYHDNEAGYGALQPFQYFGARQVTL
ncbi:MAG: S8 family peptidase [Elainellaceae cyanobacterium]